MSLFAHISKVAEEAEENERERILVETHSTALVHACIQQSEQGNTELSVPTRAIFPANVALVKQQCSAFAKEHGMTFKEFGLRLIWDPIPNGEISNDLCFLLQVVALRVWHKKWMSSVIAPLVKTLESDFERSKIFCDVTGSQIREVAVLCAINGLYLEPCDGQAQYLCFKPTPNTSYGPYEKWTLIENNNDLEPLFHEIYLEHSELSMLLVN